MRDEDPIGNAPTALAAGSEPGGAVGQGDARLEAGSHAGDYQIVRFIGAGAMGDVYEGEQPVIGKRVAVKVLKRDLASSDEALKRFTREARAVNQIDHPNVLDVFAFGRLDDGRLYFVMDLLEGSSLGEYLGEHGALSPEQALDILRPICDALDAAHIQGIVHRDLKPDNVFIAGAGDGPPRVYVLDFGIAKFIHDEAASRGLESLTSEGSWIGTPLYMAPEQWGSEEVTARSDIYSLGAMTYQMLAGNAPFKAKSLPGLMEKHFHAELPSLTTARGPSVPAGLDAALARALAKKSSDRYGSAGEFVEALAEAIGAASRVPGPRAAAAATARPSMRPFDAPRAPDSPGRVNPRTVVMAVAAGIVAAALAIGGFLVLRARAGESEQSAPVTALSVGVTSAPTGAVVFCNGRKFGVTPTTVELERGKVGTLRLVKPGYATAEAQIAPGATDIIDIDLEPITRFEGVWQRADGQLRMFKRKGERIAGYRLDAVGDDPTFLHFFEFTPSDDPERVVFGAVRDFVDGRASNEISCHIPLHAQYRYRPVSDDLELRLEEVSYDFTDGQCANPAKTWGAFEPATRLAHAGTRSHARSRAGGAMPPAPPTKKQAPAAPVEKPTKKNKKSAKKSAKKKSPPKRKKKAAPTKQAKAPPIQQERPKLDPLQQQNPKAQNLAPQQVLPPSGD